MTLTRMKREMPRREFIEWMVFYKVESDPYHKIAQSPDQIFAAFDRVTGFQPSR